MSFPITCTACHKTFTISDEIYEKKVSGRVVTIKCKSCGQGIRVDGTKGGAAAAAPAGAAEPAAAEPAAPTELVWAVDYPDGQDREFTSAEVVAELQRGAINGTTLVWRDGMAEWLELAQVSEFAAEWTKQEAKLKAEAAAKEAAAKEAAAKAAAAAKEAAAKEAAAKASAAKPAAVHKPRAPMPTAVGLAGLPGVPAAKPRAQQPSTPELPKPRAQQPSSPELPKPRAQQPSSPELPKPRAQQPSSPVLPKPPAPPPPLAAPEPATPVAAPVVAAPPPAPAPPPLAAALPLPPEPKAPELTPPLPASVAKVVSRPPQEVVPAFPSAPAMPNMASFGTAPAVVADHASVEWPESKKKTPLIIGGVVAALVVIGGGVALLGGKGDAPPPSTPIAATPPTPAATATPSPSPTPTPTAAAATQNGADTASGSDPVATAPDQGTTPGAGFAELFAAGARKAESKGATVAPSARFDAAATKLPLAQAANEAQACKQSGGPTGKVTVVVTFDPNGKASSATITEPPFAGTPTGACIAQAMKRAAIAPFSGLPGTVSKTFSLL